MGCSASRLEDEEAVRLCKDRTNFIRKALEERSKLSSGHFAYIQSLKRVSLALNQFVNGDFKQEVLLPSDPCITPPKIKPSAEFFTIDSQKPNFHIAKYLRSGQNSLIGVQEQPQVETVRIQSHYRTENNNNDGQSSSSNGLLLSHEISEHDDSERREFRVSRYLRSESEASISMQERHQPSELIRVQSYYPNDDSNYSYNYSDSLSYANMPSSSYNYDDNNNYDDKNYGNNYPPNLPQNWDSFWNPFSSLENNKYVYPNTGNYNNNYSNNNSYDRVIISDDEDVAGLKRVREREGIPDLEDDINSIELELKSESDNSDSEEEPAKETIIEETIVEQEEEKQENKLEKKRETKVEMKRNIGKKTLEGEKKDLLRENGGEKRPEFKVYVNRRPVSLKEVMREIEVQFERIAEVASEVSGLLEAGRVQFNQLGSTPSDLAGRMLNPASLFRTGSSRSSSSSRFFLGSTSFRDDDISSCFSDDTSVILNSHRSTLDRLYMWEKKLYHEVKAGEKIRIEYEKKLNQLKNQDYSGDEPGSVEKTRDALMNLRTRLKVSIHSVQSISKRIQTLRDDELYPQLMDLIQGLEKMWRAMSDCHSIQKYAIHEAKPLIFSTNFSVLSSLNLSSHSVLGPALESELKNWRHAFWSWISAQKAYTMALSEWARCCYGAKVSEGPDELKHDKSRVFSTCWRWTRLIESVSSAQVMDGLDFFSAGVGSVCGTSGTSTSKNVEIIEDEVTEMAVRVVFAGLSVAVSALADFAGDSAEKYEGLLKRCKECENDGGSKV